MWPSAVTLRHSRRRKPCLSIKKEQLNQMQLGQAMEIIYTDPGVQLLDFKVFTAFGNGIFWGILLLIILSILGLTSYAISTYEASIAASPFLSLEKPS